MLRAAWLCLPVCVAASSGCCSDDDDSRPPSLSETAVPPLAVSCGTLRSAGFDLDGTQLQVDHEPAACAADGMSCPLEQSAQLTDAAECTPGQPVQASCQGGYWQLSCVPLDEADSGTAGAGGSPT
jgi:hypothetical protein